MSTYDLVISTLAVLAIFGGAGMIVKQRMGFWSAVGLCVMVSFLWLVAWGVPKFIKHDRAQQRKEEVAKEKKEDVAMRKQNLAWGVSRFKIKVGKEPSVEQIQVALAEVREELRARDIKGSDRQWHEYVEANIAVKWDGAQWVRDDARWYQQWKN